MQGYLLQAELNYFLDAAEADCFDAIWLHYSHTSNQASFNELK